jgi:hypothetical protein
MGQWRIHRHDSPPTHGPLLKTTVKPPVFPQDITTAWFKHEPTSTLWQMVAGGEEYVVDDAVTVRRVETGSAEEGEVAQQQQGEGFICRSPMLT